MSNPALLAFCLLLSIFAHLAALGAVGLRLAPVRLAGTLAMSAPQLVGRILPPRAIELASEQSSALPKAADRAVVENKATNPVDPVTPGGVTADKEISPVMSLSVDDYLPPSRLDRIPKPTGPVDTTVNFHGMVGLVGQVELILLISSEGEVDDVILGEASLPGFLVEEAIARFKAVKFEPGRVGSMSVRSRLRIRLEPPDADELLGNPKSARERAWHR